MGSEHAKGKKMLFLFKNSKKKGELKKVGQCALMWGGIVKKKLAKVEERRNIRMRYKLRFQ